MHEPQRLSSAKRIGTGICFIVFPLVFVFAFAVHPGLLHPRLLSPAELVVRARGEDLLQFAHVLVTLNTALLIVATVHFMHRLEGSRGAWAGFIGAAMAVAGTLALAADKGALCLTMSALETIPDTEFQAMMPGLLAMFSKRGWLVLLWGLLLLPLGFGVQAVALLRSKTLPRAQAIPFLVGVLLIGTPDGAEIINVSAAVLMAIGSVPYGLQLIRAQQ